MDRNFRRVLYTALVAGGLVVVGASSAYAAGDGPSGPVTQETTGTNGAANPVDDVVEPKGIVRSILGADVAAVVDGTLGGGGLVDDLLTGGAEGPMPEGPDTEGPDTDEPGTDEPDTDEPSTEPGTDTPGTIDPPGPEEPGTEEPGTEEPGTDGPGADRPGTGRPGSGGPGAGHGTDRPGTGKPGADGPDTAEPHTARPRTTEPRTEYSGGEPPSGGPAEAIVVGPGSGGSTGTPGTEDSGPGAQGDRGTPAATPGPGKHLPGGGVDLAWRGTAGPVLTSSSGTMLAGGLDEGLRGTSTEPEAEAEPAQQIVPDTSLAETGHMITGQLSLVSLLLGLGIAALRMRRR